MTGNSAGGYFAHKMHIVHSSIVKGVGILQGGPMLPELTEEFKEENKGADPDFISEISVAHIRENHENELIDNFSNLARSAVYIFSGANDITVPKE